MKPKRRRVALPDEWCGARACEIWMDGDKGAILCMIPCGHKGRHYAELFGSVLEWGEE